jgi:hypothetical protein
VCHVAGLSWRILRLPALADCPVRERTSDCGRATGDVQPAIDVFQVGAHGGLGQAEAAGDLGVGVPGGDQVQQFPLPRGEPGSGVAAAFGVQVSPVQVRTQQGKQGAVALGEVRPGPADDQPALRPKPGAGQGKLERSRIESGEAKHPGAGRRLAGERGFSGREPARTTAAIPV